MKQTQKQIVFDLVKQAGKHGIRTEQVLIEGLRQGVSCSSRYLRWLQADGIIESERLERDKTHTWRMLPPKNHFRHCTQRARDFADERIDTDKPIRSNLTFGFNTDYLKGYEND